MPEDRPVLTGAEQHVLPAPASPVAGFRQGGAVAVVVHLHLHAGEKLFQALFHREPVERRQHGAKHHLSLRIADHAGKAHAHPLQLLPREAQLLHLALENLHNPPEKRLSGQAGVCGELGLSQQSFVLSKQSQGHLGPSHIDSCVHTHGAAPSFSI